MGKWTVGQAFIIARHIHFAPVVSGRFDDKKTVSRSRETGYIDLSRVSIEKPVRFVVERLEVKTACLFRARDGVWRAIHE